MICRLVFVFCFFSPRGHLMCSKQQQVWFKASKWTRKKNSFLPKICLWCFEKTAQLGCAVTVGLLWLPWQLQLETTKGNWFKSHNMAVFSFLIILVGGFISNRFRFAVYTRASLIASLRISRSGAFQFLTCKYCPDHNYKTGSGFIPNVVLNNKCRPHVTKVLSSRRLNPIMESRKLADSQIWHRYFSQHVKLGSWHIWHPHF